MGRWLVANRALPGGQLREELHRVTAAGPSSFRMLVPDTSAAYQVAPAASAVLLPRLAWWAASYRGPATGVEASVRARRLSQVLANVADGGWGHADG